MAIRRRGLTSQELIAKMTADMVIWENKVFGLLGTTETITRANINEWLEEFEILFARDMVLVNTRSGYEGAKLSYGVVGESLTGEAFKEVYLNRIVSLSQVDLTQARLLRNGLALKFRDKWKGFYDQYDELIKKSPGLTLSELKNIFQAKAIYKQNISLTDSMGREWKPDTYSKMWARTRAKEVDDELTKKSMVDNDLDVVLISDANTTTPICLQYEGKYFSRFGNTPGLPILDIQPPFHPNCRHKALPQREYGSEMKKQNSSIDKRVKKMDFSDAEKKQIRKEKNWNIKNRK